MEDLTDEADKLSKKFGITMSDALDHITRVKMRELDSEFNAFMENLLEKKQKVMSGSWTHTAPTDFGGGGGGFGGLPAGLEGQGKLTSGLGLIGAHSRGEITGADLQTGLAALTVSVNISGKEIWNNGGNDGLLEGEFQ